MVARNPEIERIYAISVVLRKEVFKLTLKLTKVFPNVKKRFCSLRSGKKFLFVFLSKHRIFAGLKTIVIGVV